MFQQPNLNWWTRTFSPLLYHLGIKHTILNDLLLFFYKIQSRISYSFFFPHSLSDFAHFSSFQCFTMDEKRSRAVTEAFARLYKEKLVYRYALTSGELVYSLSWWSSMFFFFFFEIALFIIFEMCSASELSSVSKFWLNLDTDSKLVLANNNIRSFLLRWFQTTPTPPPPPLFTDPIPFKSPK